MIRFSALLVAVAVGLLVAGVVTSKLVLVYVAIGVSGVALLALAVGALVKRKELFGPSTSAEPQLARPEPAAVHVSPGQPAPQAVPWGATVPAASAWPAAAAQPAPSRAGYLPAEQPLPPQPVKAQPADVAATAWRSGIPTQTERPAERPADVPRRPAAFTPRPPAGPPSPAPGVRHPARARGSGARMLPPPRRCLVSALLPHRPPLPPRHPPRRQPPRRRRPRLPSGRPRRCLRAQGRFATPRGRRLRRPPRRRALVGQRKPAAAPGPAAPGPATARRRPTRGRGPARGRRPAAGQPARRRDPATPRRREHRHRRGPGLPRRTRTRSRSGPHAGNSGQLRKLPPDTPEAPDTVDLQREVTVVPGVPRYHNPHCLLIRFMGEDDLEKMTLGEARQAGCTPCRACLPDQAEADPELDPPEPERQAEIALDVLPRRLGLRTRPRPGAPRPPGPRRRSAPRARSGPRPPPGPVRTSAAGSGR